MTLPRGGSVSSKGGFTLPGRVCLVLTDEQARGLRTLAEMRAEEDRPPHPGVDQGREAREARTNRKELPRTGVKPPEFPEVICMKCGRQFEQTIRGRQLCPDCWSFEEYLAKPVRGQGSSAEASPVTVVAPQADGQIPDPGAVTGKFRKAPALSAKFSFLARHQGTSTGDMAKGLGLARTTVRDAIDELREMGLVEVGDDGGVRLTEFGERVAEESLPQVKSEDDSQGPDSTRGEPGRVSST